MGRGVDLTDPTPAWRYGADDMAQPRRQNNATILADGTVLITGGSSTADWNDPNGRVTIAELWDPETEQVTQVAEASDIYRGYHSSALLLPDGRVLVAGGDHDSGGFQQNRNAEIYSPAYLFKGPRPTVTAAPASAELGDTIFVATPDAASIAKALMIVPGSVTHAQNWTQRANVLGVALTTGGVNITLPSNPNEAPAGYYMLFLVNEAGVPSVAKFFRAELPTVLAGDYNGDDVVDAADYVMWRNSVGQSGAGLPADGDGNGTIDGGDYGVWMAHFGEREGSGAATSGLPSRNAIPEPATFAMLLIGVAGLRPGPGRARPANRTPGVTPRR